MMSEVASKKRRLRFSLLNLVTLMTLAAMALALWRMNRELVPLRAEVVKLRNEVGYLHVDDPKRLHAIRVATDESDHWRYRVWVPEGPKYWLWRADNKIPQAGGGEQGSGCTIKPGEHLVDIKLRQDGEDKNRLMATVLIDGQRRMSGSVHEEEFDWIDNDEVGGRVASLLGVEEKAESFTAPGPMVLFRYRAQRLTRVKRNDEGRVVGHSWEGVDGPTDGVMLWIEPRNP